MTARIYLDWNATAPLRPEARAAMAAAMDVLGNPSSVHAEGRAARAIVERARAQVAAATGCAAGDVVFTSGATEAAALALAGRRARTVRRSSTIASRPGSTRALPVDADGPGDAWRTRRRASLQAANSGDRRAAGSAAPVSPASTRCRRSARCPSPSTGRARATALVSAHKLGGPKGVGALLLAPGVERDAACCAAAGRRCGRRAGTENLDRHRRASARRPRRRRRISRPASGTRSPRSEILSRRLWHRAAPATIFVGKGARRLPNTAASSFRAGRARRR